MRITLVYLVIKVTAIMTPTQRFGADVMKRGKIPLHAITFKDKKMIVLSARAIARKEDPFIVRKERDGAGIIWCRPCYLSRHACGNLDVINIKDTSMITAKKD